MIDCGTANGPSDDARVGVRLGERLGRPVADEVGANDGSSEEVPLGTDGAGADGVKDGSPDGMALGKGDGV